MGKDSLRRIYALEQLRVVGNGLGAAGGCNVHLAVPVVVAIGSDVDLAGAAARRAGAVDLAASTVAAGGDVVVAVTFTHRTVAARIGGDTRHDEGGDKQA